MRRLLDPQFVAMLGALPMMVMMCLPSRDKFKPQGMFGWYIVLLVTVVAGPMACFYVAQRIGWNKPGP